MLSVREFAERYVRLPRTSPFGNVPFRCSRQPYSGLLFDEMDRGGWKTIVVAGPSQSGKTLSAFVIPILRDIRELKMNVIAALPEADMAADKWDTDFMPTLEDSPELSWLIPTGGPGSKGGRIRDRVTLGNGVDLKIMTRGGQDTAKAGYTSPRVFVTEAAGWSHASDGSVEANPLRQLLARLKAFKRSDPRRRLTVEGTLTVEEELPWRARGDDDDEVLISTRSRLLSPCPACGGWISPGRAELVGWQDAQTEDQAAEEGRWLCPLCSHAITNDERARSVCDLRLVHAGQSVNEHGEVVGEPPPTSTLWFHWTAWHNLLRDIEDFAVAEWAAAQIEEGTEDHENAQKELAQFDFSHPFKSTLSDLDPLKPTVLRKRTAKEWGRNLLPPDTEKLTFGVDIGKWTSWWVAVAHRACGRLHIPAYGAFGVCDSPNDDEAARIVQALNNFADSVVEQGFPREGDDGLQLADAVWVDIGYRPDDVAEFIRSRGSFRENRYYGVRGRGRAQKKFPGSTSGQYTHPKKRSQSKFKIGNNWYMEPNYDRKIPEATFNADYWKLYSDARWRGDKEAPGALTLYRADTKNEHAKLSNHIANEQFKREWKPEKGLVDQWVINGDNHYKDALAMALAAGDFAGYRITEPQ